MKKILCSIPLLALLIFVLPSCSKDETPPTVDCTTVTYSGTIKPLVETHCGESNCHGPGQRGYGDLITSYDKIKGVATNGLMNTEVVVEKTMPIGGTLTETEIAQVKCWLDAGAPNN